MELTLSQTQEALKLLRELRQSPLFELWKQHCDSVKDILEGRIATVSMPTPGDILIREQAIGAYFELPMLTQWWESTEAALEEHKKDKEAEMEANNNE